MGEGKIFDMAGNEAGSFEADVSAEAIDIDYRIIDFVYTNQASNIKVFPNPFTDEIQIQGASVSGFVVRNIQGQTVYKNLDGESFDNKINLSNLKDGIYFLELNINNNVLVKKIVKK